MLMRKELWTVGQNSVASSEGWSVSLLDPRTMEYSCGAASCVLNVEYLPADQSSCIHATESSSELFPHLRERLQKAARMLKGRYIID